MATLEELERAFHADPALADLLAALDRAAAVTAAAGLTIADLLADLPAIREQVARDIWQRLHGPAAPRVRGATRGRYVGRDRRCGPQAI